MPLMVALSADFYADLIRRAVPMDEDAVAYLVRRQAPLALDIYAWLAHRLYRIEDGTRVQIPWAMLREQFADPWPATCTPTPASSGGPVASPCCRRGRLSLACWSPAPAGVYPEFCV
jgi:replication initiator protein